MNQIDALSLALWLDEEIPKRATSYTNGAWTVAVYDCLKEYAVGMHWKIHPAEKCYLGEYHCDFMLFEAGYGCRLACESQWQTHRSTVGELKWAFDKLRGVKSDVKLFIFEGTDSWQDDIREYLDGYAQLDTVETFIFLRWNHKHFERFWWKPIVSGVQPETFKPRSF